MKNKKNIDGKTSKKEKLSTKFCGKLYLFIFCRIIPDTRVKTFPFLWTLQIEKKKNAPHKGRTSTFTEF